MATVQEDIFSILKQIKAAHPELRVGQILLDAINTPSDLFYVTDEVLLKRLKDFAKLLREKSR